MTSKTSWGREREVKADPVGGREGTELALKSWVPILPSNLPPPLIKLLLLIQAGPNPPTPYIFSSSPLLSGVAET